MKPTASASSLQPGALATAASSSARGASPTGSALTGSSTLDFSALLQQQSNRAASGGPVAPARPEFRAPAATASHKANAPAPQPPARPSAPEAQGMQGSSQGTRETHGTQSMQGTQRSANAKAGDASRTDAPDRDPRAKAQADASDAAEKASAQTTDGANETPDATRDEATETATAPGDALAGWLALQTGTPVEVAGTLGEGGWEQSQTKAEVQTEALPLATSALQTPEGQTPPPAGATGSSTDPSAVLQNIGAWSQPATAQALAAHDTEGGVPGLDPLAATAALAPLATALPRLGGTGTEAVQVNLGTGPGQPDFAETFSLQLKHLASQGVQEATLHLNPADLGQISVQIALDGTQAKVDFSASAASTRALLQASLADLSQALQDAGLQFAGGDVRDQGTRGDPHSAGAAHRHAGARTGGASASGTEADEPTARSIARAALGQGRLDLFA